MSGSPRIELDPPAIERMIRSAALEDLRHDTPAAERERSLGRAATALDALCGACDRDGPDAVWDVLEQPGSPAAADVRDVRGERAGDDGLRDESARDA